MELLSSERIFDALVAEGRHTTAVGTFPGGSCAYDRQDMASNAYEWTSSLIMANNDEEAGQLVNAVRGGSWHSTGSSCKSTGRGEGRPASGAYHSVGFRVLAAPKLDSEAISDAGCEVAESRRELDRFLGFSNLLDDNLP
jgi:formylglycine-generating enzyme required for sulfatase activity